MLRVEVVDGSLPRAPVARFDQPRPHLWQRQLFAVDADALVRDERLVRALAPNIFEFEDVKRGVLLQLFGGANKDFRESGRGRFRGELNVLLCGDPGTSKSQMLQYAVNISVCALLPLLKAPI